MQIRSTGRSRPVSLLCPLSAAVLLACGIESVSAAALPAAAVQRQAALHAFLQKHPFTPQTRAAFGHPVLPNFAHQGLHHSIAATAATIAVTSCADDQSPGTLRAAINGAVSGDTIDLSGLSCSSITLTQGALPVGVDDLSLLGPTAGTLAIDGNGSDRVIRHTGAGTLSISHLTLRNGRYGNSAGPASGGCLLSSGEALLEHATISGCSVVSTASIASGGGVAAYMITSNASVITGNSATGATAAIGGGGFAYTSKTPPPVFTSGRPLVPSGTSPAGPGSGEFYSTTISNNRVEAPTAFGGGLGMKYSLLAVYSTISGNVSHSTALSSSSGPYLAADGGAFVAGPTTIVYSTISDNAATTLAGSTTFAFAGGIGGGKYAGGLTLAASTVSNNHADVIGGGAMSKYGVNLLQSTISNNSAGGFGGGLEVGNYGSSQSAFLHAYNSTVADNSAVYAGGGVYLAGTVSATLVSNLVANNTAPVGADIYVRPSTPLVIGGSNNLIRDVVGATVPGDTLDADPLLQPLADNGGPTLTQALSPRSPALGRGANPNGYADDQRGPGFPRSDANGVAIGAVQAISGATAPPIVPEAAPALSTWALGAMAALLGAFGLRRRRRPG